MSVSVKQHVTAALLWLMAAAVVLLLVQSGSAFSFDRQQARDPGVRGGDAGAGGPLPALSATQNALFVDGLADFAEAEDVADGLGPRMNLDSCAGCHL